MATTTTFGRNTGDDVASGGDTYLNDGADDDTNFSTAAVVITKFDGAGSGFTREGALRFGGLGALAGLTVLSAELVMVYKNPNSPTEDLDAYQCDIDFVPSEATWNDSESGVPWPSSDHGSGALLETLTPAGVVQGSENRVTISPAIMEAAIAAGWIGFILRQEDVSVHGWNVESAESTDGLRPYLEITTEDPAAPDPDTVSATPLSDTEIRVNVVDGGGSTSRTLHQSTSSGFTPDAGNEIKSGVAPGDHDISGLDPGTTYYFKTLATNDEGSTESNEASATTADDDCNVLPAAHVVSSAPAAAAAARPDCGSPAGSVSGPASPTEARVGESDLCVASSHADRVDIGVYAYFAFRIDGELTVFGNGECVDPDDRTCDILLIAGTKDSIFWSDLAGAPLDPAVDNPVMRALLGGAGGSGNANGQDGGSGGGGGARSPSFAGTHTAGGSAVPGQGHAGGGGIMGLGVASPNSVAASGGGGASKTPGGPPAWAGFPGAPIRGYGGEGLNLSSLGWPNIALGRGEDGEAKKVVGGPTGDLVGGRGAGGYETHEDVVLQTGTFQVEVGFGAAMWGDAVDGAGLVLIRIPLFDIDPTVLVASGGVESDDGVHDYHVFTADGVLEVTTPGSAEVLVVGGGGGGGSGVGGGGGGGEVQVATVNFPEAGSVPITVGAGGAGGTAGGRGSSGAPSSIGDLLEALGGGGGAGAAVAAHDGASGGGGFDGSLGGLGSPLRGFRGGRGKGYFHDLSGARISFAGGGGGSGGEGDPGADEQFSGNALSDEWDPGSYAINKPLRRVDHTGSNNRHAMFKSGVARSKMMVQARAVIVNSELGGNGVAIHIGTERGTGQRTNGYELSFTRSWPELRLEDVGVSTQLDVATPGGHNSALGQDRTLQLYVADGVQEGSVDQFTLSAADTHFDGKADRTFGPALYRASGVVHGGWLYLAAFADRYLSVEGLPAGYEVQILDADDAVVFSAVEAAGVALVDCYMNGDVTKEVPVPSDYIGHPLGWPTLRVLDDLGAEVTRMTGGGFYPGAELEYDAGELAYLLDADELPIGGLIASDDFNGETPGPRTGDGGPEADIDGFGDAVLTPAGFGAGGGAGSESVIAGLGGAGAGDGSIADDVAPGGAAEANSGGGGGGSGDPSQAGGAGGSGIVVVRMPV